MQEMAGSERKEDGEIQYEDWVDIEDEVDSFAITRELEAEAALAES